MAEVFAPFIINRTMHNLTFYCMEGRNFVRTKSSLTRKRVLRSPEFERTRYHARLMAKASMIGSFVYNALPQYWRQGWMYRSFTGEALTLLKAGKKEDEIQQNLLQQYVEIVVNKRPAKEAIAALPVQPKRAYRKLDTTYWNGKTIKSKRRKAHKQKLLYNADLMGQASKIGSKLYGQLPRKYANRGYYQYLTGLAFRLLKQEISEVDIVTELRLTLPPAEQSVKGNTTHEHNTARKKMAGLVSYPGGQYHFINCSTKRLAKSSKLLLRSMPTNAFLNQIRLFVIGIQAGDPCGSCQQSTLKLPCKSDQLLTICRSDIRILEI